MDPTYRAIADLIQASHSFLVTTHIDPDGDAIGCALAIFSILKRLGKDVKVICEEPIPDTFAFLEGSDQVLNSGPAACEVAVVVDAAGIDRVGWVADLVRACPAIVNIDHHKSNDDFGHHNLVDTRAGACGEVVYNLSKAMGVLLEQNEAEALYVALLSDTGCFRFPNTTSVTLRVAGDLVDLGVSPYHAASEIFWKRSDSALRLLSNALSTIEVTNGGSIATMEITKPMYEETGATSRDTEGFANYPRSIQDVRVGVLIREIGDRRFRISLRSREGFPIDGIAKAFGGGGHPTAAGCRLEGDLQSVKSTLRERIAAEILSTGSATSSS